MRGGVIDSRWLATSVLTLGGLLLVWMYPLAYLERAGKWQGQLCGDVYGIPGEFAAEGKQLEQVISTERWSVWPPGWSCEFRAYQSDLLITREPPRVDLVGRGRCSRAGCGGGRMARAHPTEGVSESHRGALKSRHLVVAGV